MVYINSPKAPVAKAGYHTSNPNYLESFICTKVLKLLISLQVFG